MKTVYQYKNNVVLDENSVEIKPCINRESKSLELTIKLNGCHDINMKFLVVVTPLSIYHNGRTTFLWKNVNGVVSFHFQFKWRLDIFQDTNLLDNGKKTQES